jgi:hypothetical protein
MKKIFFFLLRKYSKTESQRMEIYKELWYQTKAESNFGVDAFDNMYNMNTEVLMSNPFFVSRVMLGQDEHLLKLKIGLADSFDESVELTLKN